MFGGLRPYRLSPINRGCINTVVFLATNEDGTWIDKTEKQLYLTAKTQPWDNDNDDSDAIFKVGGAIPDPTNEPGRVVFTISERQSYHDPGTYYCDIVEVDENGDYANRLFIGQFEIIGGANNAEAGGDTVDNGDGE